MSKVIPIALAAHYRSGNTTLARLWKIVRKDEIVFGFTDHDVDLPFGGTLYRTTSGFDPSAISSRAETNVDNMEVLGRLNEEGITGEDIEAGLWDGAKVEVRQVNWADLSMGSEILRVGVLGNIQRKRGEYVAELRGLMQFLQNNIGRTITPTCDADLGDSRCKVDLEALRDTSSVAAVVSQREFLATELGAVDDWFSGGEVTFVTGACAGLRMEIKRHTAQGSPATDGRLVLQLPMPMPIAVDDVFTIVPGCDKRKEIDSNDALVGDCAAKFDNVVNFRGFSFVPGPDRVGQIGGQ